MPSRESSTRACSRSANSPPASARSLLLLEIFNHIPLVSIDPASEEQHQKWPRLSSHLSEFR